jgi:glycosidase
MALWYRGDGPWWKKTNLADDDGVSLEEQRGVSGSLYEHCRRLISLRRTEPALQSGALQEIPHASPAAVVFARFPTRTTDRTFLVAVNLSTNRLDLVLDLSVTGLSGALSDALPPAGETPPPVTMENRARYPLRLAPYEARLR